MRGHLELGTPRSGAEWLLALQTPLPALPAAILAPNAAPRARRGPRANVGIVGCLRERIGLFISLTGGINTLHTDTELIPDTCLGT